MFSDWELSGKVSVEELGFFHNKLDPQQHNNYLSAAIEPEIYKEWNNGKQSFIFAPFLDIPSIIIDVLMLIFVN